MSLISIIKRLFGGESNHVPPLQTTANPMPEPKRGDKLGASNGNGVDYFGTSLFHPAAAKIVEAQEKAIAREGADKIDAVLYSVGKPSTPRPTIEMKFPPRDKAEWIGNWHTSGEKPAESQEPPLPRGISTTDNGHYRVTIGGGKNDSGKRVTRVFSTLEEAKAARKFGLAMKKKGWA